MRSKMKLLGTAGVAAMALIAVMPSAEAQAPASGLKASIAARITPTRQNDRPGGSAVSSEFLPGESKRLNLTAGRGGDLCETGVWAMEPTAAPSPVFQARVDAQEAAALYVWHFDVGMREVATDRIVFDLVWERISRSSPNTPLRGKQSIILREGQSHTIDLIHGPQNSACMSVVVDIVAHVDDDVALQGQTLEWDLWFTGAQPGPAHRALTSLQGESAAFQFDPIPISGVQPGAKDGTVNVYGQLRGRVRADGNIDVALTAIRFVNSGARNRTRLPRSISPVSNSGQKNFVVRPGETIKIVLPPINTAPIQFQTDPITGERTVTAGPRPAQPTGASPANEMSITVQARVR